jgi:hypothetical protein
MLHRKAKFSARSERVRERERERESNKKSLSRGKQRLESGARQAINSALPPCTQKKTKSKKKGGKHSLGSHSQERLKNFFREVKLG